jgi:hypothetical protein
VSGSGDRSCRALIDAAVGAGAGASSGVGVVCIGSGGDPVGDTDMGEGGGTANGAAIAGGCDRVSVQVRGAVGRVACVRASA